MLIVFSILYLFVLPQSCLNHTRRPKCHRQNRERVLTCQLPDDIRDILMIITISRFEIREIIVFRDLSRSPELLSVYTIRVILINHYVDRLLLKL